MFAIRPVLDHYDIQYRERPGNQKIRCPNPGHEDRDPSASLKVDEGVWCCHACGESGTAVDIVMLREGVEWREARSITEGLAGPDDERVSVGSPDLGGLLPSRPRHQHGGKRYVPPWLR